MTKKTASKSSDKKAELSLSSVKALSFQTLYQESAKALEKIQESFSKVSQTIASTFQQLSDLEAAIEVKQRELQQLHEVEAKLLEIETLEEKISNLLTTHEEYRKAWSREEADYIYDRDTSRRLEEDAFKEEEVALRKKWEEREAQLAKQEEEVVTLRQQVASFPETLQKATLDAVVEITNKLKLQHETRMTILEKDYQTEKRVHEQHLSSMQAQILTLKDQNNALKVALDKSQTDMKDLMTKYFELNSGREALQILERNRVSDSSVPPRK